APLEERVPTPAPPLGRCSHCHWGHPEDDREDYLAAREKDERACAGCHRRHPAFGPISYTSSLLLPFDTDGDGNAQGDESDDERAGGIGTEALLSFDVPLADRPGGRFTIPVGLVTDPRRPGPVTRVET